MLEPEAVEEMFSGLGHVTIRRMFGGQGIYHNGLIIALVVDGEVMLKADSETAPVFASAGSTPWRYDMKGKTGTMPYWSLPDGAADDADIMAPWARLAYEASRRSALLKTAKLKSKRRPGS